MLGKMLTVYIAVILASSFLASTMAVLRALNELSEPSSGTRIVLMLSNQNQLCPILDKFRSNYQK